jgi:regulator of sigma E protease
MTIILFIIGLSALIFVHEFGHFIAAKRFGLLVEEFGFGFPPRLFAKKIGETVYSFNLLPFGGFVRIYGERDDRTSARATPPARSFLSLPLGRRAIIMIAGIVMNFLMGWLLFSALFMIGVPNAVIITDVASGAPAERVGLVPGDRIVGYGTTQKFIDFVSGARGEPVTFDVLRGSETVSVSVTPRVDPPPGEGALGIMLADAGIPRHGIFASLSQGFLSSFRILGMIFVALWGLIVSIFAGAPAIEQFVGPVGIFGVASQVGQFGLAYLLQLLGLISMNLVALNILPFPVLDGGRLLFLTIEKFKGSPLPQKVEIAANALGFALLILFMVVVTVKDVVKLF